MNTQNDWPLRAEEHPGYVDWKDEGAENSVHLLVSEYKYAAFSIKERDAYKEALQLIVNGDYEGLSTVTRFSK